MTESYMDGRRSAPAAERNRGPILEVLRSVLAESGTALEISSGTGQHAAYFAQHLPKWTFQPTDVSESALESIAAWQAHMQRGNLLPPQRLDACSDPWPIDSADAILNINMVHISPFEACEGLMRGAAQILSPGAPLIMYGPYRVDFQHTAESNAKFDAWLKAQDPSWGVRDVSEVRSAAEAMGFELEKRIAMPANNFSLVFRRT